MLCQINSCFLSLSISFQWNSILCHQKVFLFSAFSLFISSSSSSSYSKLDHSFNDDSDDVPLNARSMCIRTTWWILFHNFRDIFEKKTFVCHFFFLFAESQLYITSAKEMEWTHGEDDSVILTGRGLQGWCIIKNHFILKGEFWWE